MWHWLLHVLGIDDVSGPWYAAWSGFVGDVGLLGAAYAILRRHNCHVRHCWRIGRQPVDGTTWTVCRRHHPDGAPSRDHLAAAADQQTQMLAQLVTEVRTLNSHIQRGGFGIPPAPSTPHREEDTPWSRSGKG